MKKDVIFLWIPKVAGTSIYEKLHKHGCRKLKFNYQFTKFNNQGIVTFGHVDVQKLLANKYIKPDYFKKAFKFCFARNPFERAVSLYFYRRYNKEMSFTLFCQKLMNPIRPIGLYNNMGLSQANQQVDWILKNGKPIVDFIGRYENLKTDIRKVFNKIGVKGDIGCKNKTGHKEYKYYYNEINYNMVASIYHDDIKYFGYKF